MSIDLDSVIMGVAAKWKDDDHIILKYLAIAGGCGAELTINRKLARETIAVLRAALDEGQDPTKQSRISH